LPAATIDTPAYYKAADHCPTFYITLHPFSLNRFVLGGRLLSKANYKMQVNRALWSANSQTGMLSVGTWVVLVDVPS